MPWIILIIFIGAPLLELSVLIDVGGEIGAVPTVLLCLLTAGIGLSLVRLQGLKVIQSMQAATRSGKAIGESLIHGFFLLIAGIFLFIPGFVTDSLGALLLIPFVRVFLGKAGLAHIVVRTRTSAPAANDGVTIDGEFYEAGEQPVTPADTTVITDVTPKNAPTDTFDREK